MTQVDPNLGLFYNWGAGYNGWNANMDSNLLKLGALVNLSVLSADISVPPVSPSNGDRYIVAAGATGVWAGNSQNVAVFVQGNWEFFSGFSYPLVYVADQNLIYTYNGTSWVTIPYASLAGNNTFTGSNTFTNAVTVTPSISITSTTGDTFLGLNSPIGNYTGTYLYKGGLPRWYLFSTNQAETGSNAGSNFEIASYDDTGVFLHSSMIIARNTGIPNFPVGATTVTASLFNISTTVASTQFVQLASGNLSNVTATSTGFALSTFYLGQSILLNFSATSNQTFTLPAASSCLPGSSIYFYNANSIYNMILDAGAGVEIFPYPATRLYTLLPGMTVQLVTDTGNWWTFGSNYGITPAAGDNSTRVATTAFVRTLGNGYGVLANSQTWTGNNLFTGTISTSNTVNITSFAGTAGGLELIDQATGNFRWFVGKEGDAESGGNAGSDFIIGSYADSGAYLAYGLVINRSTGVTNFTATPTFPTVGSGDNSTSGATTAFVKNQAYAPLAGNNIFTGVNDFSMGVTAGTPTAGYNTGLNVQTGAGYATQVIFYSGSTSKWAFTNYSDNHFSLVCSGIGDVFTVAAGGTATNFTSTPTFPTVGSGDNSTSGATTAFVKNLGYASLAGNNIFTGNNNFSLGVTAGSSSAAFNVGMNIQAAAGYSTQAIFYSGSTSKWAFSNYADNHFSFASVGVGDVFTVAAGGTITSFTGTPTFPTVALSDNSINGATTAFVKNQNYAPLAGSNIFTGVNVFSNTQLITSGVLSVGASSLAGNSSVNIQSGAGYVAQTTFFSGSTEKWAFINYADNHFSFASVGVGDIFTVDAGGAIAKFVGTPTFPTVGSGDSSINGATTAFVKNQNYAPLTGNNTFTGNNNFSLGLTAGNPTAIFNAGLNVQSAPGYATQTVFYSGSTPKWAFSNYADNHFSFASVGVNDVFTVAAGAAIANFIGPPTFPTALSSDNSISGATTAFVKNQNYAPLTGNNFWYGTNTWDNNVAFNADVNMTGATVEIPTAPTGTSSPVAASTAFVHNQIADGLPAYFGSSSGYQKFPTGLIIQWMGVTTSGGGVTTVTYPITFPNGCIALTGSVIINAPHIVTVGTAGASSATVYVWNSTSGALPADSFYIIALGY